MFVDLPADLNDRDADGFCFSLKHTARDPAVVESGSVIVEGNEDAPAFVEVIDQRDLGEVTLVRFRILQGHFEGYENALDRFQGWV